MDESLVVRRETQVAAPPATVFAFLTDPQKILSWMGAEADTDAHPGGLYLVKDIAGRPGRTARGQFREVVPGPSPRLQLWLGRRRECPAGIEPGRDRPDRSGRRHAGAHDPYRTSQRLRARRTREGLGLLSWQAGSRRHGRRSGSRPRPAGLRGACGLARVKPFCLPACASIPR